MASSPGPDPHEFVPLDLALACPAPPSPASLARAAAAAAAPPLRVLVAHNRYQQRGGEDAVVDSEVELLRSRGHAVHEYRRDNHELETMPPAAAAGQTLWSRRTVADIDRLMHEFRPDLVHVHNTFPLISPSLYWAAARHRLPVVQTLHNFRLVCPQGLMLREGRPCEDCVGRLPWRAVRHRCYRDSAAQSAVLATMIAGHRGLGTWSRKVTRYIALNDFCRDRFVAGGLPAAKLRVKFNFVDVPAPPDGPRHGFLFVGRLSAEKGVGVLAQALRAQRLEEPVFIAGTGPEQHLLEGLPGVVRLGNLAPEQVYERMRSTRALVLPSLCYENFPRTLAEAFGCGQPVIGSRHGAMAALLEEHRTGLLFAPGDAAALASTLQWALQHPGELGEMGRRARARYERELTGESNYRQLLAIYREAIESTCQSS
ncbi:glycosyltransferase [Rubrivivax gelatinosus]|uniref:glycosyltransferase n=1 Tax=Rubrivivax gelatinosus TaxID=28068 RepID=UPI001A2D4806|nr:glycosyltransferase [Rubrivivax gelatinosus]MBG6081033.1 glycosyltransferase involved in cell wall biosynthesis [Rubrivivax gelatinosus]